MRVRSHPGQSNEQGVVLTLIAVFMLFVVGAMAVLAIDVVSFYTARSEAQLAADGAALAGARVLANSGMTSSNVGTVATNAALFCQTVAKQVANSNLVSGQAPGTVTVSCNPTQSQSNPTVTVRVQSNIPTFFARIWGSTQITVAASATAEAYNPSGLATGGTPPAPVATTCVKPWLLPNIDPNNPPNPIFDTTTGQIQDYGLLTGSPVGTLLQTACTNCTLPPSTTTFPLAATKWEFIPGDTATSFPPPPAASVTCSPAVGGFTSTAYELAIAGCVQTPIACNAQLNADLVNYGARRSETARGVNCLAHTETNGGDTVDTTNNTPPPFEFLSGLDNPLVTAGTGLNSEADLFVSDSIVTVPVFDSSVWPPPQPVQVIGFVQLFLSPAGLQTPQFGANRGRVTTTIINMVGCGTGATGTPTIIGNGPSAVPVRLITPP